MTIVITGASQGIGRALAEAFAEAEGAAARLAPVARSEDKLRAVAEACRACGAEAQPFPCDVTDDDAVAATAEHVRGTWGAPDVLVNNAGLFEPGALADITPAAFRRQVAVNLTSAFVVTRAFLPAMLERGAGHVFYTASVASIKAYPGGAAYGAAKHGLRGLARNVREETKAHGLRVTTLLLGATYTPSWAASGLPEERFIPPEDVARVVLAAHRLSPRTVAEEILLRPQQGDV